MNEPGNAGKDERKWLTQWVPGIVLWLLIGAILVNAIFIKPWNRRPEMARQALCAANLNGIGKGIILYQSEHNDMPPPNLAALVADGQPADFLRCPGSGTKKSSTTQPADIAAHCDYIYAPPDAYARRSKRPAMVMAFELPANHRQYIVNVLFNDCHVESIEIGRFVSLVQELNDYHAELRRQSQ
ncbi:MAG: hypothetical protein SVV80_13485 [Planctomycetota bacterium]|nr:hypothetical protein [Planctomycetota bacterium]